MGIEQKLHASIATAAVNPRPADPLHPLPRLHYYLTSTVPISAYSAHRQTSNDHPAAHSLRTTRQSTKTSPIVTLHSRSLSVPMAATRRRHIDVFEDTDAPDAPKAEHDIETTLLNALRPLKDASSSKANVQLNPSTTSRSGSSPSKKNSSPLRPMSSHHLRHFKLSPPRRPSFPTDSPQKNGGFYNIYQQVAPAPEHPLYPPATYEKENALESAASFGDLAVPAACMEPDYGYKAPNKRTSMDASSMRQPVKKQKMDNEPCEMPHPTEMPLVVDDGTKPSHSYAELIGMAILRAPHRRLTLAQIYKWISDNFSFYRSNEGGWQNSIRHNLSLNKNFIKQERPKDDPGKGNYWAIKPGEERPFLLGKKQPLRKIVNPDGSTYVNGLPMPPSEDPAGFRPGSAPVIANFTMAPSSSRRVDSKNFDLAKFPDDAELSSEGTIPASDPALQDDDDDRNDTVAMPPPPPVLLRSSPPPHDLGSSPPALDSHRRGTPPPAARLPSSSRSRGERRKFAGLNDSGYWSSIESSAARGAARQLTSETEIRNHRIKKGRAEAEIARIRSSSFDSPSRDENRFHNLPAPFGSSPAHRDGHPLTPAVVFKRPMKPPPTISPNTNLRDHRNAVRALLGSPGKGLSPMPNTWSPAFTLNDDGPLGLTPFISPYKQNKTPWRPVSDTSNTLNFSNNAAFDIFIDAPEEDIITRGSPEKRSSRRPSLARAATSTGILADITGTAQSNNNDLMLAPTDDSPFSFSPFMANTSSLKSPAKLGSPLKRSNKPPTSDVPAGGLNWFHVGLGAGNVGDSSETNSRDVNELFGVEFNSDGSEEGIDIFQDFGKIGQQTHMLMPAPDRSTGSPVKKSSMGPPPARPSVNRNNPSRW